MAPSFQDQEPPENPVRFISLDGSCLDVADTQENRASFGSPGASRGESAFPQLRFVALAENGTHVLFGARLGRYADSETTLAHDVLTALRPGVSQSFWRLPCVEPAGGL